MESNTNQIYHQSHQPSSGLLRFRSAPSSLLANFNVASGVEKGGPGSDRLMSRFMGSNGGESNLSSPTFREFEDKSRLTATDSDAAYANSSQHRYMALPPHYPRHNDAIDGSYQFLSVNQHVKSENSNLARQNSSPPGLFTSLSSRSGYGSMKRLLSYGGVSGGNAELSSSTNELKRHLSLSSRRPSPLGIISEVENEGAGQEFPYGQWSDAAFSGLKREPEGDAKLFAVSQQNGESGNRLSMLSHHLSLPRPTPEVAPVEKLLHFQDSVPCKIRAKRGCATHPRSIAERVRRTRISERMRKLQELVPHMDKQTNTADMLDLAVEYIKDLQRQFKSLSDSRANCTCMNAERPLQNQIS